MSPRVRRSWLVLLFLLSCERPKPPSEFDAAFALATIERQLAPGPRVPNTPAHRATGNWLDSLLRTRADTVIVQSWTHVDAAGDSLALRNFLARFNRTAPERILLLAHWDSRPRSDGPNSRNPQLPVPGANDGGSGVAVLLGVADALHKHAPERGVDLLFVDGEDFGDFTNHPLDVLIGSRYFAAHQPDGRRPSYAVLFDLVGDKDLQIYEEGNSLTGAPEIVEKVWAAAAALGYQKYFVASPRHTLIDDHVELQKVGIRAIDVVDFDYPYWHTPDDTFDKVSATSLKIVGDVALTLIRER